MYFNSFRGVFDAVKSGMCRYGVLPIENSIHGSVNEVYDLMEDYEFYIVKSIKMQVNHVYSSPAASVSQPNSCLSPAIIFGA